MRHIYCTVTVEDTPPDVKMYHIFNVSQPNSFEPRYEKTGDREADQRLCFRHIDSTIPLLSKSEVSSF